MRKAVVSGIFVAALASVCTATGQPKQTAQAYRDAASKTRCQANKVCYAERAAYHDCLAGSAAARCAEPKCKVVECADDASVGVAPQAPSNVGVEAGDAWESRRKAHAEADGKLGAMDKRREAADVERACYEYLSRKLVQAQMSARGARSCALRHAVLPRMPRLILPKKCETEPMRALLAGAGRALVEGDLETALDRYTEVHLAAPDWSEVALVRALVLEALGRTADAEAALKTLPRTVARLPAWAKASRDKGAKEEAKCRELVVKATTQVPGGVRSFDPAKCEAKK